MTSGSARGRSGAAEAAARLRHDLAKYIRFSAPAAIEPETDALRERLRADVLTTRRAASGAAPAADVFDEWRRAEQAHFAPGAALAVRVAAIARAIDEIRALAARIEALGRPELERLDLLTRNVSEDCRALEREAKDERSAP
jgi:hypothetical protein